LFSDVSEHAQIDLGRKALIRPRALSDTLSCNWALWCDDYPVCSSRVRASANDLIAGSASRTIGNIVTQAINQDASQFQKKLPVARDGRLAIPAAIKHVSPDWMNAKTK
jgi:hypothetical protein